MICLNSLYRIWAVSESTTCERGQEGWLSLTERASVSAISLRHIIWLPHESHAGMSLLTADLRVRHLATSRESKAHFGLLWVRPWDNRGKCYMDRKRIQCWSNASQHIHIYLQSFLKYSDISVASDWLSRVSTLTRYIDIAILSVCPSVCLSVTRWYCMKTA